MGGDILGGGVGRYVWVWFAWMCGFEVVSESINIDEVQDAGCERDAIAML